VRLKYYLRGIGIGLIVTTVVLMIAFAVHKDEPLSDDEIRERAAALGMVMPESDKLSAQRENESGRPEDEANNQTDNQTGQKETDASKTDDVSVGDEDSAKKEEKQDHKQDDKKDEEKEPEVTEQVEISIVGGEYSDEICTKLKEAGVIEDAEDFNKYLSSGGYDNLLQPGNYVLPLGADYDEIVRILTERE